MQFPTPSGLKSAVGTKNARYHIVCIQNAAAQAELYTKALTDQWANKTPQQAFDILSKPDVTVTNQSDKRDQLPKIKALDMRVQGAFQAVDAQLHQRVAVSAEAAARAKAELDAFERDKGVKADDDDPLRKAAAQMEREAAAARAAQESHALAIAHGMMPNKRSVRSAWMVVRPSWPAAWPAPRDVSAVLAVMCALLMGELTGLTSVAVAVYTLYAIVCDFVLALALFVAVTTVAFFGAQLAWWRWRATRWRANARWFVSSHGMLSFGLKVPRSRLCLAPLIRSADAGTSHSAATAGTSPAPAVGGRTSRASFGSRYRAFWACASIRQLRMLTVSPLRSSQPCHGPSCWLTSASLSSVNAAC
jgi:hypothetical protein